MRRRYNIAHRILDEDVARSQKNCDLQFDLGKWEIPIFAYVSHLSCLHGDTVLIVRSKDWHKGDRGRRELHGGGIVDAYSICNDARPQHGTFAVPKTHPRTVLCFFGRDVLSVFWRRNLRRLHNAGWSFQFLPKKIRVQVFAASRLHRCPKLLTVLSSLNFGVAGAD